MNKMGIYPDRENTRFLQDLSNTMLNALNGSMAAADVLSKKLEKGSQEELTAYLAIIRHDQHKLLHIAENMRVLASIRLEKTTFHYDAFDMNALCTSLVQTISALVEGISLTFEPSPDGCATIGDAKSIERLILSLLANSLRRCAPGDMISVKAFRDSTTVMVTIHDNGSRANTQTTHTAFEGSVYGSETVEADEGASLDIRVAEGIAGLHGGAVSIQTQDGGTTAVFTMPYRWDNRLHMPTSQYGGYMRSVLTALAGVLDYHKYTSPFL